MKLFKLTIFLILLSNLLTSAQTEEVKIRPSINRIVNSLRKDDIVHFGYAVGYSAVPETNNKYYKLYLKLKEKATNEELVLLTRDNSEIIIVYAFSILRSRNHEKLLDIFKEHINDTRIYWTAGGCTGVINKVNRFMLMELKPSNQLTTKNYLTIDEYEIYWKNFQKIDPEFFSE